MKIRAHTLVDHWLDGLMDVVMDMFAGDYWLGRLCPLAFNAVLRAAILSCLVGETTSGLFFVAMLEFSFLKRSLLVVMLLWQDLLMRYRLLGGVMMMLMNL